MIKLTDLLERLDKTPLPAEKLLRWFLDRINNTFIFFDTETTGLMRYKDNEHDNQITQISAIASHINGETLRFYEIDRFNIGVKLKDFITKQMETEPDAPEDEDSVEYEFWLKRTKKGILKYNHYDFVNSDSFEEERKALEKFDSFLKSHGNVTLIAHNAPFDIKFIAFHELFKESTYEIIDSMEFFERFFFPILETISKNNEYYKSKLDKFPSNDSGRKSRSLGSIATGFNDDYNQLIKKLDNAHNAIVDCEITMEIFQNGLLMIHSHLNE